MAEHKLTLTDAEYRVVSVAVDEYRRRKGAERMLRGQKDNALYTRYDALLAIVKALQARLEPTS